MDKTFLSLAEVKAALIAEDVEGFINLGAPNNEYDREAEAITSALSALSKEQFTEANIITTIAFVWAKAFNRSRDEIAMRMPAFQHIAEKLLLE